MLITLSIGVSAIMIISPKKTIPYEKVSSIAVKGVCFIIHLIMNFILTVHPNILVTLPLLGLPKVVLKSKRHSK